MGHRSTNKEERVADGGSKLGEQMSMWARGDKYKLSICQGCFLSFLRKTNMLDQGSTTFFALRTGVSLSLALIFRLALNKTMNVWHVQIHYNS